MSDFLYHGTSMCAWEKILKDGRVAPRGPRVGNWDHTVSSNPDAVYLTTVYGAHYAKAALEDVDEDSTPCVIIEVHKALLIEDKFAPDEDFLEQATRKMSPSAAPISTKSRVRYFRDLIRTEYQNLWPSSLESLGTCCYFGEIPLAAISRVAIIPREHRLLLLSDPVVCLANHSFMGAFYRNLNKRIFGDSGYEDEPFVRSLNLDDVPRAGIRILVPGSNDTFLEID